MLPILPCSTLQILKFKCYNGAEVPKSEKSESVAETNYQFPELKKLHIEAGNAWGNSGPMSPGISPSTRRLWGPNPISVATKNAKNLIEIILIIEKYELYDAFKDLGNNIPYII